MSLPAQRPADHAEGGIPSSGDDDLLSSELVDEPTSASAASDVAAIAYSLDTDIERFFIDLTIAESSYTPSITLEEVLEERRQRDERRERIKQRADEMLQDALKNEEHVSDVRLLSEAVDFLGAERPAADGTQVGTDEAARGRSDAKELELDVSYPTFGTAEGAQPASADSKAAELRREAEVLRAYLKHGAHSDAYKRFIEKARTEAGGAHTVPDGDVGDKPHVRNSEFGKS